LQQKRATLRSTENPPEHSERLENVAGAGAIKRRSAADIPGASESI
jgi:hypothetical protein